MSNQPDRQVSAAIKNAHHLFKIAVDSLRIETVNVDFREIHDDGIRLWYQKQLKEPSNFYRQQVISEKPTPKKSAKEVVNMRNKIMKIARRGSLDIGAAVAKKSSAIIMNYIFAVLGSS